METHWRVVGRDASKAVFRNVHLKKNLNSETGAPWCWGHGSAKACKAAATDHTIVTKIDWRVPNPPGANPLVAERAFPTTDYWGRTGVARCAEEMTGICRDFQFGC